MGYIRVGVLRQLSRRYKGKYMPYGVILIRLIKQYRHVWIYNGWQFECSRQQTMFVKRSNQTETKLFWLKLMRISIVLPGRPNVDFIIHNFLLSMIYQSHICGIWQEDITKCGRVIYAGSFKTIHWFYEGATWNRFPLIWFVAKGGYWWPSIPFTRAK